MEWHMMKDMIRPMIRSDQEAPPEPPPPEPDPPLTFSTFEVTAQQFSPEQATAATVGTRATEFNEDTSIVYFGCPFNDIGAEVNTGEVWFMDGVTLAKLDDIPGVDEGQRFGWSIAYHTGILVVGLPFWDTGVSPFEIGQVKVFDAATKALLHTFSNPVSPESTQFGTSVAIDDTYIVVGAPLEDVSGVTDGGSVYVYDRATYALVHTIPNPTPSAGDDFGDSVVLNGNYLIVGADDEDSPAEAPFIVVGAVHVFNITDASFLYRITSPAPDQVSGARFGTSISSQGDFILVGVPEATAGDTPRADVGRVYLYRLSTGDLLRTIESPSRNEAGQTTERFGSVVKMDLSTRTCVVCAENYDEPGFVNAGRVYMFDYLDGTLLQTFPNPGLGAINSGGFGEGMALQGQKICIVAPQNGDPNGSTSAGEYFIYEPIP